MRFVSETDFQYWKSSNDFNFPTSQSAVYMESGFDEEFG